MTARLHSKVRLAALSLGLSLIGGCGSISVPPLPETTRLEPTRTAFVNELPGTEAVAPNWWTYFDDPDLVRLVERALRENRSLAVTRANVAEAEALLRRARLDGSYGTSVDASAELGKDAGTSGIDLDLVGGLGASWELDAFGGIEAQVRAATLNRDALIQAQRDVAVIVAAQTAQAYLDLRGAQQRLAVAEENAALQEEALDLINELVEAGRSNALDFNRARTLYLTTRASLPTFRASVETALSRIAALTGVAAGNPDPFINGLREVGPVPHHQGLVQTGSPSELVRRRPDIRQAEADLAQRLALGEVERARLFPQIVFNADINSFFGSFRSLGQTNSFGFGIGPAISWEGPDLRRVRADIDAVDAQALASFAIYEQTVFDALSDVESALSLYGRELERRDDLTRATETASNALELARLRFEEGLDDYLDVLDAQRTLLSAQDDLVQNDILITTYAISTYRELGGMWTYEELQPPVQTDTLTAAAESPRT